MTVEQKMAAIDVAAKALNDAIQALAGGTSLDQFIMPGECEIDPAGCHTYVNVAGTIHRYKVRSKGSV